MEAGGWTIQVWKPSATKLDGNWFVLNGMNKDEGLPLDKLIHAIASGGFVSPQEEMTFLQQHPNIDLTKPDHWKLAAETGRIGRCVHAVRNLWVKIEDDPLLILKPSKNYDDENLAHKEVVGRLHQITAGSFKYDKFYQSMDAEETSDNEEDQQNAIPISGIFLKEHIKKMEQGKPHLVALAKQLELVKNRVCLHLALDDIASASTSHVSYAFSKHFNNKAIDKTTKDSWKCEGPLLRITTEHAVHARREAFKTLLTSAIEKESPTRKQPLIDVQSKSSKIRKFVFRIFFSNNTLSLSF
jgi:hypothetical protein